MTEDAVFTDIDLNTASTTEICNSRYTNIGGVYMKNGGTTAEIELQVTNGTDTATLAVPGAGNNLEFSGDASLGSDDTLQIEVTTKEGSSQTNTAAVFKRE